MQPLCRQSTIELCPWQRLARCVGSQWFGQGGVKPAAMGVSEPNDKERLQCGAPVKSNLR